MVLRPQDPSRKPRRGRCTPNRSSSTPCPAWRARPWWVLARPVHRYRCCAWNCSAQSDSPALREALRAKPPHGCPMRTCSTSWCIRRSRRYPSQRQDRAKSSPSGPAPNWRSAHENPGHRRRWFLGQALCRGLVERGHQVLAFNRSHYPELQAMGVGQIRGDLADAQAVLHAVAGDAVFTMVPRPARGAAMTATTRPMWSAPTTSSQPAAHRIGWLVYTSTPSVTHRYPSGGRPRRRRGAVRRRFPGAVRGRKAIAEQRCWPPTMPRWRRWRCVRADLGPWRSAAGAAPGRAQGRLRLVGDGSNKVDTTYIDNAALAHFLAFEALGPGACAGKAYFISNGEPLPMRAGEQAVGCGGCADGGQGDQPRPPSHRRCLRAAVAAALRGEPPLTRFLAEQLCTPHWYSMEPARRDFGYVPQVSIE